MYCRACRDLANPSSRRCPPEWGASAIIGSVGGIPIEHPKRLSISSSGQRPLSWLVDRQMLFASPCIRAQSPQRCLRPSPRPVWRCTLPRRRPDICLTLSINSQRTLTGVSSIGAASQCLGDLMARMRRKTDMPAKLCVVCRRPFVWRKKWVRDWPNVKYCSDHCRAASSRSASRPGLAPS